MCGDTIILYCSHNVKCPKVEHFLVYYFGGPIVFYLLITYFVNNEWYCLYICFSLHTDFVCWRGLLTKILTTPYERRDGWIIAVTLYNDTYYMCEFDTEELLNAKENKSTREKHMAYWGYKFEQYLTSGLYNVWTCFLVIILFYFLVSSYFFIFFFTSLVFPTFLLLFASAVSKYRELLSKCVYYCTIIKVIFLHDISPNLRQNMILSYKMYTQVILVQFPVK